MTLTLRLDELEIMLLLKKRLPLTLVPLDTVRFRNTRIHELHFVTTFRSQTFQFITDVYK